MEESIYILVSGGDNYQTKIRHFQLCLIAGGFFRLPSGHTVSILDAWPDLLELPSGKRLGSY